MPTTDESYKIPELEWIYKNYNCKIMFYEKRWRCGYVQIPKTHPCFLVNSYDDFPIIVHGGLTYGGYSDKLNENWIGFDTNHAGDRMSTDEERRGHFWTLSEVKEETERIVDQLETITLLDCANEKIKWFPDWFKTNFQITKLQDGNA